MRLLIFPSASGEPQSPPVLLFGLDFPVSSEDVEAVVGALERLVRALPPDNSSSATSSLYTKTIIKSISDLSLHGSLPLVGFLRFWVGFLFLRFWLLLLGVVVVVV